MVKELSFWLIIGFIASAIWVVWLIDMLYKWQFTVQHDAMESKWNEEWIKLHGKDSGTPKLGGILIWITVPAVLMGFFWAVPFLRALALIVLIVGAYGFVDDYLTMLIKKNLIFREFQERFEWRLGKFLVSILVNVLVAICIIFVAGITQVTVFNWILPLNTFLGVVLVSITASVLMYSTEVIDGIDALAAGMYVVTLLGFTLFALAIPAAFVTSAGTSVMVAIGVLLGVLFVYLYFNIPPARVYMGGPGAMPMGAVFLAIALKGNILIALFIMMLPYLLDLASSFIQIIAIRFFKRKVFRIAPVHHHFESLGWPGPKVVMRFWLFNWITVFVALVVQLYFFM
jgi:phospho-N-acetylmuramoyl-pentapeptide-transferase